MRIGLVLLNVALMACTAPRAEPPDTVSAPHPDAGERMVGTVRIVGSAPVNVQVVLQPEEGRSIQLTGPLRAELERLGGAEVAVRGPMGSAPDPIVNRQIQVTDYEILAIDGQPVITGTVEGVVNNWTLLRTPDGQLVYLASAPGQLQVGQKVWVQGPRAAIVQAYGVLRQ